MAKKFILVDQSISGIAGHHYEYAVHVLRAAEEAGYEPLLVTNVAFRHSPRQIPWNTYAVYEQGFWASEGAPKWNLLAKILAMGSSIRFRWMLAQQFSLPGILWLQRRNVRRFAQLQMRRQGKPMEAAALLMQAVALSVLGLLAILLLLPLAVVFLALRRFTRILNLRRFPGSRGQVWMRLLQKRRHQKGFRRDTGKMLRLIDAREGDIVFIPTLSVTELAGLAEFIETSPEARRIGWHVLFRRNIFVGRECDYDRQDDVANELRHSFQSSAEKLKTAGVRFYTDTEELTRQYNRLKVLEFETVPIPHTHAPAVENHARSALRILYVGDARGEKGYHLLPGIVESLWERYVEPGRISFHIQSNFNIPLGEPRASIARGQLEHLAGKTTGTVELLKEPLNSEQYRELLLSGDINLLLYDVDNYYARSSGILVEALSAGMPVVVPAGTWLARQFAEDVSRWHNGLPERMVALKARRMAELQWRVHSKAGLDPIIHGELTAEFKERSCTSAELPAGATHLLLRLRLTGETTEVLVHADQFDGNKGAILIGPARLVEADAEGKAVVLMRLHPSTVTLALALSSSRAGMTVRARDLEIVFLSPRHGCDPPPVSVVGTAYHDIAEIPQLLEEIINHYGHYSATARRFAAGWGARHNAKELIRTLEGQSKSMAAEALV